MAVSNAKKRFSEPRELGHVSDIVMCSRQRVFNELDKGDKPLSDKTLGFFTAGKAIHEIIQSLFMTNRMRFEKEKYVEYQGIEGHVDLWDKHKNVPLELKTYYGDYEPTKPKEYNKDQLEYYMAILDSPVGVIIYQFLSKSIEKNFKQFNVEMTVKQRQEKLSTLTTKMKKLRNGVRLKSPQLADGVWNTDLKWLCNDCKYLKECEEMRPGK